MDAEEQRNATWETNHQKIVAVISKHMEWHRKSPPTVTEISEATGLSRKTIYKHFKEYSTHDAFAERKEMFGMMEVDVLMGICKYAITGNVKAARLYLELLGRIKPHTGVVQGASNNTNVQINGIVLNQQILQNLSPEQLKKIEAIIKTPYHGYDISEVQEATPNP